MPKFPMSKHGRILPEDFESLSEEERRNLQMPEANPDLPMPKKKRKNPNELETTEWERVCIVF